MVRLWANPLVGRGTKVPNFNSKMVRLWVNTYNDGHIYANKFQFQNGTIMSHSNTRSYHGKRIFQFQNGTIMRIGTTVGGSDVVDFNSKMVRLWAFHRFLASTRMVISIPKWYDYEPFPSPISSKCSNFNSKMVRLWDCFFDELDRYDLYFNSKMVRLWVWKSLVLVRVKQNFNSKMVRLWETKSEYIFHNN